MPTRPGERIAPWLARDAFSYIHYPMVAGIIAFALGLKKTLEHTDEPLKPMVAAALACGPALYLLAHMAFRARVVQSFAWTRIVAIVALVAVTPLGAEVDAIVFLTVVTAIMVALITVETLLYSERGHRLDAQT